MLYHPVRTRCYGKPTSHQTFAFQICAFICIQFVPFLALILSSTKRKNRYCSSTTDPTIVRSWCRFLGESMFEVKIIDERDAVTDLKIKTGSSICGLKMKSLAAILEVPIHYIEIPLGRAFFCDD